jgi:pyruvate kinase
MRQLSLSFGVVARHIPRDIKGRESLNQAICRLLETDQVKAEDLIIVLAGNFGKTHGPSYIEISTALNFKEKFN